MDVEKLARKLEPLMPKEVAHWMKVRDMADPDLRALIERQIISTAHRVLGDFRRKILLSLPPEKLCKGTFHLGTVLYDGARWPFGLSTAELLQNSAVLGRSGAGKTNLAFHILEQLAAQKVPFLFLDWKRTGRHMLPCLKNRVNVYTPGRSLAPLRFNPFVTPPGLEPEVYINQVIDVLSDAYTLGDGARSILQRALAGCYADGSASPTVTDLINRVEALPSSGREREWKVSTLRALRSLDFAKLTSIDPVSQEQLAQNLLTESTIIELDALGGAEKKFLVPLLCLWLFYVQLSRPVREHLQLLILLEEAHNLVYRGERHARESVMNMLLRQCREIGIGFMVIDQHPHLVSSAAQAVYTTLFMNLKDPTDVNRAAATCGMDEEDKRAFSMLPVGQGICKLQARWHRPFLLQFPHVEVAKGSMTDELLRAYSARNSQGTRRNRFKGQEFRQVSRVSLEDGVLNHVELQMLEDVVHHPDDGVKVRYQRLGSGIGRGNRTKEDLIRRGWLEAETLALGRARTVVLRLTAKASEFLGVEPSTGYPESIEHQYWKRAWARSLAEQGYEVQLEAPRNGGRIDVLAKKDGRSVAIEIETGKSDVVANVRRGLRAGVNEVLVVATDEVAMRKVEKELGKEGLLIEGRVRVTLSRLHTSGSRNSP